MRKPETIKPYKTGHSTTYAAGAYAVIELLETRPDLAIHVYFHPLYREQAALSALCRQKFVPFSVDGAAFHRINQKENTYVLATVRLVSHVLSPIRPHIVLVNPADQGNLGTILRTAAGLGLSDLAVIAPCADIWHPKTIRASMGAIFRQRFAVFPTFSAYREQFPAHECFAFMLLGEPLPFVLAKAENPLFALVFGSEAAGLDDSFTALARPVRIPQTNDVDSYNHAAAFAIGAYGFTRRFSDSF